MGSLRWPLGCSLLPIGTQPRPNREENAPPRKTSPRDLGKVPGVCTTRKEVPQVRISVFTLERGTQERAVPATRPCAQCGSAGGGEQRMPPADWGRARLLGAPGRGRAGGSARSANGRCCLGNGRRWRRAQRREIVRDVRRRGPESAGPARPHGLIGDPGRKPKPERGSRVRTRRPRACRIPGPLSPGSPLDAAL